MKAAIYCRKSTATEGRSKSREEQLERSEQDAKNFGFAEVEVYMEEEGQKGEWWWQDSLGRNPAPHRPELTRLVKAIEDGHINAVIVYKQDRLVRDSGVNDGLAKLFRQHGVSYICQGRDTEIETARGLYQTAVDSAAARQWRDQIGEDVRRDHEYKARLGMFTRDPSCFGLRSAGKESQAVVPIWDEIDLIRRIYTMFVYGEDQGPLGVSGIANQLMDEGISLAVGAKGHQAKNPGRVHTSQVTSILSNPAYMGLWRHNGVVYKCDRLLVKRDEAGESETIVPISLFEAAQAKLAARRPTGKKAETSSHLLTGLVVCGCCGRPLQVNHRKRADGTVRHTYVCPRKRDTIPCTREGIANVLTPQIDEWVLGHLAPWVSEEHRRLQSAREPNEERQLLADLETQIEVAKRRETEELASAVGVLDPDQLLAVASLLKGRRQALDNQALELRGRIAAATNDLPALASLDYSKLAPTHLKALLRSSVQWIAVTSSGVVALTSWGTWVGGELVARVPEVWNGSGESRRTILPPSPTSCLDCPEWLPRRDIFVAGRRQFIGPRGNHMTDDAILPIPHGCNQEEQAA